MALQIWLPLKGDTHNQGLSRTNVTSNGVTFSDGPNGGSVHVSGTSQRVSIPSEEWMRPTNERPFSISLFVKPYNFNYIIAAGAFEIRMVETLTQFRIGDGSSPYTCNAQDAVTRTLGKWYHMCGTWDNTTKKVSLYVDGKLTAQGNSTVTQFKEISNNINLVYGGEWDICDFRMYDNCLSAFDVQEIYVQKVYELQPQWRHNDGITILGDASGMGPLTSQTISNVSMSGNSLYFNGTSASNIQMPSIGNSGGTLSIWFNCDKPGNSFLYCDPSSKMALTFYSNGTYLIPIVAGSGKRYSTAGITWGAWNHVATTYDASGAPVQTYINGKKATLSGSDHWTSSETGYGTIFIGRSNWSASNFFKGYINEIRVYTQQLTEEQVKEIYNDGPVPNKWETRTPALEVHEESGATWLKLLRHENPTSQMFTTSNWKNNEEEQRFSKLYLLDDTSLFLRGNGTYEFMEKECLTAGASVWRGRWTQTSSPTRDGAASGFVRIFSTTLGGLTVGIGTSGSNALFNRANGNWWCATGCVAKHQNGIPGYSGVITTGYQEFFVRIDGTKFMEL